VAAVYNQADFGTGGLDCITDVGLPLEMAIGEYEKAYDTWQACFEDYACDVDSIDPELQTHWTKASNQIERSDSALEHFKVGSRPQPPKKPKELR
jgi:hypothetical protein